MVFEVCVVEQPTKAEAEEGALERVVFFTKEPIPATDAEAARIEVLRSHVPEGVDSNRLRVVVVPFG